MKKLRLPSKKTVKRSIVNYTKMLFSLNNSYRSKTVPLFYIKLNFG